MKYFSNIAPYQCDFTISVRVKLLHQGVTFLPAHGLTHLAQLGRGDEAGIVLVYRLQSQTVVLSERNLLPLLTHLECENSPVEVLRLSLLINVLLQHLRSAITAGQEGQNMLSKEFLPLCKVQEGVFLNKSRFVCDSV